jgi:nucleotidyltransferase/DNA polymerase involved in DNA repair
MLHLDLSRVIAVFDADYFYCQVEINESGEQSLRSRPVAVFQKHVVVTCNYKAREFGVRKLISLTEAKRLCPELILFCGEDLTPYREAQEEICEVLEEELRELSDVLTLQRCETVGLDEYIVDLTDIVERRLRLENAEKSQAQCFPQYFGAVFPRDFGPLVNSNDICSISRSDEYRLAEASNVVYRLRRTIFDQTNISLSCGISFNKMLAKFAANMRKPDGQTCFLPSIAADAWLQSLDVRCLPYVGRRLERLLAEHFNIQKVADLRQRFETPDSLEIAMRDSFGAHAPIFCKRASVLWFAAYGNFTEKVRPRELPKCIHVEDSSRGWDFYSKGFAEKLRAVCFAHARRMEREACRHCRIPRKFSVFWRQGQDVRHSRRIPMGLSDQSKFRRLLMRRSPNFSEEYSKILSARALELLMKFVGQTPDRPCTLIGVGCSDFAALQQSTPVPGRLLSNNSEKSERVGYQSTFPCQGMDSACAADESACSFWDRKRNDPLESDFADPVATHGDLATVQNASTFSPRLSASSAPSKCAAGIHVCSGPLAEHTKTLSCSGVRQSHETGDSESMRMISAPVCSATLKQQEFVSNTSCTSQLQTFASDIRTWFRVKSPTDVRSEHGTRLSSSRERNFIQKRTFLDRWLASDHGKS